MSTNSSASDSLTARQREWLTHLHSWREQGGTLKAYAQTHALSVSGLYTARRLLSQRGVWQRAPEETPGATTPKLISVRLATARPGPSMFRVLLPSGVIVEVPEQGNFERLPALLSCIAESVR